MDPIKVRFFDPASKGELTLTLPRETRFSALTPLLYEKGFLRPQKPGYRYLYCEHLCGSNHSLGDYIPERAGEMALEIFHYPEVLV